MGTLSLPSQRLLSSRWYFLVLGLIFIGVWMGAYLALHPVLSGTSSVYRYYALYGIYVPLIFGFLTIVKSYVLELILSVIRLGGFISRLIIYLILYGFWLVLGVQLTYYEPRYTDIAIVLIDAYGRPLVIASGVTLLLVLVLAFCKKK